jgi:methylmalonyl-CoA mutase cobalamin-binding subunit
MPDIKSLLDRFSTTVERFNKQDRTAEELKMAEGTSCRCAIATPASARHDARAKAESSFHAAAP